jgi:hypothetical protein
LLFKFSDLFSLAQFIYASHESLRHSESLDFRISQCFSSIKYILPPSNFGLIYLETLCIDKRMDGRDGVNTMVGSRSPRFVSKRRKMGQMERDEPEVGNNRESEMIQVLQYRACQCVIG